MIRNMDGIELKHGWLNIESIAECTEHTEDTSVPNGAFRWPTEECQIETVVLDDRLEIDPINGIIIQKIEITFDQ